ncbi:synaptic vesicle glycoprotein 2B isoform X2 [Electrophorus electricus]|uniref:synaptic vesicle glycoprotein 2B isoform X2 n=1 Tax=Electrophorus electricus TaxID=8005 RepID=UPI0015CF9A92|nr:synaptic vesicle glycoprotein 2B isoform X2 [Electrophorus electricus]
MSQLYVEAYGDTAREPLLAASSNIVTTSHDSDNEGDVVFERTLDASNDHRKLSYEEAVEEAGFGLSHGLLLVVCGWANASDAVEILCVSFLLPTARCDMQLSSADMGLLTASIFLVLMTDSRWSYFLCSVGGSIPVIFSYFSEFQPRMRRGAMISALATFWMAGNLLAAGAAWLIIPKTFLHIELGWLDFQSWRVFVVVCSIPSLTSALIFRLVMPESPRFLMEAGREEEALTVFQWMYKLNHRGDLNSFPAAGLVIPREDGDKGDPRIRVRCSQGIYHSVKRGLAPITQLFVSPLTSRSIALLIIFYCISFGFYGLWMWLPELFKRAEAGGSPCSNMSEAQSYENKSCYPVKTAVYMEGFITAASNLPGSIFTILLMDVVGGKILLAGSLLVSSLSVFLIYEVKTKGQSFLMSCVFSGVSVISWNALDVISTELYPTHLRSSSLGFFNGVGRVAAIMANVVFGQLVDSNCALPIVLVAALLLTGSLAALHLPPTKQTELT